MSWNPRRKCILDLRIQEAHLKYLWSQSSLQSRHFFLFLHLYLFHFFGDNGVFCLYFLWCIYSFLRTQPHYLVFTSFTTEDAPCPTPCNLMDCSPPASSCPWGFSRPEYWSGFLCPPPGDLFNPGIEPRSPTLQKDSLPSEPPGNPKNTGVSSLFLLQGIFLTQELNWGLLHCRQILYQLSYRENPYGFPQMVPSSGLCVTFRSNTYR